MKKLLVILFPFILTILAFKTYAADLSVTPLYLEFDRKMQKKQSFKIMVEASAATKIIVTPYIASQDLSGKLAFVEQPAQDIIKIKKNQIKFNRKEMKHIEGYVIFPKKVNKTLVYALMIEEEKNKADKGIAIKVRYAVVFKISTDQRRVFEKGKMEDILIKSVKDKILLQGTFENQTVKDYYVKSVAYIRDNKNKLIQKVDLRTASSWQKGTADSIVFPSSKVYLVGQIKNNLVAGNYNVTILNKLNNKRQIVAKKEIIISDEMLKEMVVKEIPKEVVVTPTPIEMTLRKGSAGFYRILLANNSEAERVLNFPTLTLDQSEKKGFIKFVPEELNLKPGQKRTILLKVKNNTNKKWQPKKLELLVNDSNKQLKQTISIPVLFKYKE